MARDYTKIKAWQFADQLAMEIYKSTKDFPKSEIFGLTSQMRRSAVSVPANIVEGSARRHQKEYVHFLYIAMGSLAELSYYIRFSKEIGYLKKNQYGILDSQYQQTVKTLRGLINYIEASSKSKV
ncbi:four helix bundle protein [candidate division TA06 bacterium]|nr:four helix bundle protein [candidate division TA06 bacterium]